MNSASRGYFNSAIVSSIDLDRLLVWNMDWNVNFSRQRDQRAFGFGFSVSQRYSFPWDIFCAGELCLSTHLPLLTRFFGLSVVSTALSIPFASISSLPFSILHNVTLFFRNYTTLVICIAIRGESVLSRNAK